jgi:hypothetical protein
VRLTPVLASLPSDCSAVLASSRAFSKRAVARSTSLRVLDDDDPPLERLLVDRVRLLAARGLLAGFFAAGMNWSPLSGGAGSVKPTHITHRCVGRLT